MAVVTFACGSSQAFTGETDEAGLALVVVGGDSYGGPQTATVLDSTDAAVATLDAVA